MAIARINASWQWFRAVAKRVPDYPRLERELLAAGMVKVRGREIRRGLTAELTGDEIRTLAERLPKDARVQAALEGLEASEARDRARPRVADRRAAERRWKNGDA